MSPWWAIAGLCAFAAIVFLAALAGYLAEIRWYREYDRANPGVAEKLGVKERR